MLEFLKGSFLALTLFLLLYIHDLSDNVICNIAYYTTFYSICDKVSNLWQQLGLVWEIESMWTEAASGLLISMLEKLNTGLLLVTDVKMNGSVIEEKSSFKGPLMTTALS